MTLPLFDPPSTFDRAGLAARLHDLAREGIWIGTSSWKYNGWLDQIYSRERYMTRGRFSQKRFEAECLTEFAETFPIVCGDFSFYQFPAPEFWQKLFASAPAPLKFALKVPEEVTVEIFPRHARYGPRAGMANESFLNAELLKAKIIGPYVLGSAYPELSKHALVCVTETTSRAQIESFATGVKRALEQPL